MWLNDKEPELMGPFLEMIRSAPQKALLLAWTSGTKIIVSHDASYESDNCFEEDDPNYEEFWVCLVKIVKIICLSENDNLAIPAEGQFYEITYHNIPEHYEPAHSFA